MKHILLRSLLFLILPALALAQGSLTPPGAPAPSMKTLDQLEPRIPLTQPAGSTTGLTLLAPGSYYLTGNITVATGAGIQINASNVTLDLNGFTISSTANPAASAAIYLPTSQQNITIRNGHVNGSATVDTSGNVTPAGFFYGIYSDSILSNCLVTDLTIRGMSASGIYLDIGSTIERCVVTSCGTIGIHGQVVANCSATNCGQIGIRALTVSNSNGGGALTNGILAFYSAINCYGESTGGPGIEAKNASNCYGTSNSGWGLSAQEATNCHGKTKTGTRGLNATSTATGCSGMIGPDENDPPGTVPSVASAFALFADTASNCTGSITLAGPNSCALQATVANNCTGRVTAVDTGATGTCGLRANTALNSLGNCPAGAGLKVYAIATGCQGVSGSGIGLDANGVTTNCTGTSTSGIGLQAASANTCTATTTSGSRAMGVYGTASGCYGIHGANGVAISAAITIGCVAQQGTILATNRYNMP